MNPHSPYGAAPPMAPAPMAPAPMAPAPMAPAPMAPHAAVRPVEAVVELPSHPVAAVVAELVMTAVTGAVVSDAAVPFAVPIVLVSAFVSLASESFLVYDRAAQTVTYVGLTLLGKSGTPIALANAVAHKDTRRDKTVTRNKYGKVRKVEHYTVHEAWIHDASGQWKGQRLFDSRNESKVIAFLGYLTALLGKPDPQRNLTDDRNAAKTGAWVRLVVALLTLGTTAFGVLAFAMPTAIADRARDDGRHASLAMLAFLALVVVVPAAFRVRRRVRAALTDPFEEVFGVQKAWPLKAGTALALAVTLGLFAWGVQMSVSWANSTRTIETARDTARTESPTAPTANAEHPSWSPVAPEAAERVWSPPTPLDHGPIRRSLEAASFTVSDGGSSLDVMRGEAFRFDARGQAGQTLRVTGYGFRSMIATTRVVGQTLVTSHGPREEMRTTLLDAVGAETSSTSFERVLNARGFTRVFSYGERGTQGQLRGNSYGLVTTDLTARPGRRCAHNAYVALCVDAFVAPEHSATPGADADAWARYGMNLLAP